MRRILAVAVFAVLAVPLLALAQTCEQQSCDGLTTLPPQSPPARSFADFITLAYQGAYCRPATCSELQNGLFDAGLPPCGPGDGDGGPCDRGRVDPALICR